MRTKQLQCFLTAVLVLQLFSFGAQGKGRPFITRWKGEAGKELYISIKGENYKLVIKKADGTVLKTETSLTGSYRYIPTKSGELIVEADTEGVRSFSCWYGSAEALLRVEQFGTVQWQTMHSAFYGCKNMQFASGIDTPDLSQVTSMERMFFGCTSFNQPLNNWNVSKVTNMSGMFAGCTSFNQPLNNWNVSKVTNMYDMFSGCTSFNQALGMWKLEKCGSLVLDACGMSVENFSKSLVGWAAQTNINRYLSLCAGGLKYNESGKAARQQLIKRKGWDIRGDSDENGRPFITRWQGKADKELEIPIIGREYWMVIKKASDGSVLKADYSNNSYRYTPTEDGELLVEAGPEGVSSFQMEREDYSAEALLRVEQFGTVQWQTMQYAFRHCKNMQFAEGIDTPDLSKVTDMSYMFWGCTSFNQPLNNWDVSKVWSMKDMFCGCSSFNQELGMWKLEKCEKLGLDNCGMSVENYSKSLEGWAAQANIKQGLLLSANGLKYNKSALAPRKQLVKNKKWSISDDVYENGPFITRWQGKAGDVLYIPIKGENYRLVIKKANGTVLKTETSLTTTSGEHYYQFTLTETGELLVEAGPDGVSSFQMRDKQGNEYIHSYHSAKALLRVEQFGTVQWKTMKDAFYNCINLQFAERIDSPDLSEVTDMNSMFMGCISFNQSLNNWDVSKVTNMSSMFAGCTSFKQPLNNWDVSKVTDMSYMFSGCTSFNQPLNNWNVSRVTRMSSMFYGCTSFNQPLNNWNVSRVTRMSSMFYGCTSFNQPLNSWDVSKVTDMSSMFFGCTSFNQPLNSWDVSKVTFMTKMFSGCTSFNQDLGMWRLEQCRALELGNCGMSAENYSKSLLGWAAQSDINERLRLDASRLEYFPEATESRKKLINNKSWSIIGDRLLPYYISFKTRTLTLTKGEEHTLVLTKKGFDASETVVLTSSDPYTVQIIDAASLTIKGLKAGKATITATVAGNWNHWPMKTTCEVFVTVPATGVTLSETELPLLIGATETLTATVIPSDATNKRVRWSSNNTAVATVENGTVTAVSAGNATITVTTEDGNHTATCEVVVVTDPVPVTGVTLSQTKLPLLRGATAKLTATVSPTGATNRKITWSSNNTTVATVENGTVTAVSAGNAIITVTTEDGNHTARCEVVVTDPIPVSGVTLSQTKLPLLRGATAKLTATVSPADATNKKVRWSSNNTAVAIVENGTIAAVSVGNATITVTTEDGNHTARCEVVVTAPVPAASVTLSQTELILRKGATAKLTATVLPTDATNKKVRWSSNNTAVAIVESGTVAALSAGNATITVTTEDGNYTARCEVVVTDPIPVTGVTLSQTELPLLKGATAGLTATVFPSDATNKKVRWSSNNTAVAIVESGTVAALSAGNATITVTTEDGNHTATCSVAVEATSAVEDAVFASVVVSPNPFGEQLCITYGDLRGQYVLYNAQGVVVASEGLEDGETRINTASFTAGVYLLRLTAENGATKNYTVVKD